MTPRTRSGAEHFADLLDGTVARDDLAPEDSSALRTTELLRQRAERLVAGPSDADRQRARARLMARIAVEPHESAGRPPLLRRRAVVSVLAGTATAVMLVSVAVVGSRGSLPGQPLYAVKRATESVQLATADGPVDLGTRHLKLAERRVAEIETLVRQARSAPPPPPGPADRAGLPGSVQATVRQTLANMDEQTRVGSELLLQQAEAPTSSTEPLRTLITWSDKQRGVVQQLVSVLPPAAAASLQASVQLLVNLNRQATSQLADRTGGQAAAPSASPSVQPSATLPSPRPAAAPSRQPAAPPAAGPEAAGGPAPAAPPAAGPGAARGPAPAAPPAVSGPGAAGGPAPAPRPSAKGVIGIDVGPLPSPGVPVVSETAITPLAESSPAPVNTTRSPGPVRAQPPASPQPSPAQPSVEASDSPAAVPQPSPPLPAAVEGRPPPDSALAEGAPPAGTGAPERASTDEPVVPGPPVAVEPDRSDAASETQPEAGTVA